MPNRPASIHDIVNKAAVVMPSSAIRTAFQEVLHPGVELLTIDSKYWCLPVNVWDQVLQHFGPDVNKYRPERYDCDDFAICFKGHCSHEFEINSCAWVLDFSGKHSYNAIVVAVPGGQPEVHYLEPQADRWVRSGQTHYPLTRGLVIL